MRGLKRVPTGIIWAISEISPIFDIYRSVDQSCTCLVVHIQNELLNILEPLFNRSTMKILDC
jgi:hypothetical protein